MAAVSVPDTAVTDRSGGDRVVVRAETGWQWHTSRTGSWIRPSTAGATAEAAAALGPAAPGPGQITVVVDPEDSVEVARAVGWACHRAGRFVVHTSPGQRRAWRLQTEVLGALGKHWDRPAQGGDATCAQLAQAWLRAERARELVVLRAHHITGPALNWLLSLPTQEGLRVWLITPRSLPTVADVDDVAVTWMTAAEVGHSVSSHDPRGCGCEDLNDLAPLIPSASATVGLSVDIARRLRRLYDIEAAALAAAAVLLGRPDPDVLAAARVRVALGAEAITTADGTMYPVPEYAHALLRGWAGRCLWPEDWACDIAATYLTLRLEEAERHSGVELIAPDLPLLPPVAWHERRDPGAEQLAWLTRSQWLCRRSP
jgi:hypothetical protein